jgi:hypothetical protein
MTSPTKEMGVKALYRGAFKGDLTVLNIRWSVMKE